MHVTYFKSRTGIKDRELLKFTPQSVITGKLRKITLTLPRGKFVKNNSQTSAVHDHMLFRKTVVCPEDFSILVNSSCNLKLEIQV